MSSIELNKDRISIFKITKAKNAINVLGGEIEKVESITLPDSDMVRNIVIIKKIKQTLSLALVF